MRALDWPPSVLSHPSSGPGWPPALACARESDAGPLQKQPAAAPMVDSSTRECPRAARQRSSCRKREVAAAGAEAPEALVRRVPSFWPKLARAARLPRASNSARHGAAPTAFTRAAELCQHLHLPSSLWPARASTHATSRLLRSLRIVYDQRMAAQPQRSRMRGPDCLSPGQSPSVNDSRYRCE